MRDDQDTTPAPGRSSGLGLYWLVIGFLVIAYPLSVGPVARYTPPSTAVNALYRPLKLLYDHSATAQALFDWYVEDVWGVQ